MRVAIANRGEVALRIIYACEELGLSHVLIHSKEDRQTIAYRRADDTVELDGTNAQETYLHIEKVVAAAKKSGAQLVHPGFGFLSENADFAAAVAKAKMVFVGPSPKALQLAGDKIAAKELATSLGIPTIASSLEPEEDEKKLLAKAKKIGFPIVIKAAAGGGGKGIKIVEDEKNFATQLASAQREGLASFADGRVFIEKYLENPRHIEIQVARDVDGQARHFFERECSVQRRFQKILEESPSPLLKNGTLREKLTTAAIKLIEAADYTNSGTVEFLVDSKGDFYFLELNARLQVEHAVTEMVCGVDLVQMQLALAQGEPMPWSQDQIQLRGHALEARLYAEDPSNHFFPSVGKIALLNLPLAPQRRFDLGYEAGDEITTLYDPMIGKVITWAQSRAQNLKRMHATLSQTVIFGVHTNIEFLKDALVHKDFAQGQATTKFIEEHYGNYRLADLSESQKMAIDEARQHTGTTNTTPGLQTSHYQSPWFGQR